MNEQNKVLETTASQSSVSSATQDPALLIDYVRDVVGMPMRGLHGGRHIGWTTDADKHELAVAAGANSTTCAATTGRVIGYEVTFAVGREVREDVAA